MKDTDETPLGENESVIVDLLVLETWIELWAENLRLIERLEDCEKRIMDLEQRKVANENNQKDPEWY